MRKAPWFLSVLLLLAFFITPLSAFAATASPRTVTHPASVLSSDFLQPIKLSPGQQIDLPQKDGTTRHIKLSLRAKATGTALSSAPLSASGCATDSESEWGTNIFGGILYKYTVSQYMCWNGSAITYLPAQNAGWQTCCGWGLSSQSSYRAWISSPWSAYAHGNFVFYGPLGSSVVSGWVEIYVYGDGSYWGQAG
jgi:hypothetical protein